MIRGKTYILTGTQGSGKTSFLSKLIKELQLENIKVGGFVAKGIWQNGKRFGFNLIRIKDRVSIPLCTKDFNESYLQFGHFYFNPAAISLGNEILNQDAKNTDIIVIDEIGIFELEEEVWFNSFRQLLQTYPKPLIITVRENIVDMVIEKFDLQHVKVFGVNDDVRQISEAILSELNKK